MKIAELILIARTDYLDDPIGDLLWDDDFMFRAFSEAERQACNRQNFLYDDNIPITLVADQTTYRLPTNITKIDKFIFQNNVIGHLSKHELERLRPAWREETGMTDNVIEYFIQARNIRFVPSPTVDDDGLVVTLESFRLPLKSKVNAGYIPEIPEEYHRDLIYWVLHNAYKKQDADAYGQERADYFLNRFTEVFGEYISAEVRINQMEQRSSLHLRPTPYAMKLTRTTHTDSIDGVW